MTSIGVPLEVLSWHLIFVICCILLITVIKCLRELIYLIGTFDISTCHGFMAPSLHHPNFTSRKILPFSNSAFGS